MAITTSDFVYPYFIDTSDDNAVTFLTQIITWVEEKLSHIEGDADVVKTMIVGFVYALYTSEQLRTNTSIGNVNLNAANGVKESNLQRSIQIYNDSVEIYNKLRSDEDEEYSYVNEFGL
jgi:hypothetical protein